MTDLAVPAVMGVVNVTPDSFVPDVRTPDLTSALARCHQLVADGASVIDIGGESTRPGAEPVATDAELARVIPLIETFAAERQLPVMLSIDTRDPEVARQAVGAGATMINDMGSTLHDLAGELGVQYVAAHMQGDPRTMQAQPTYDDVVAEVRTEVLGTARRAKAAGAPKVWIDPGIGFGKRDAHNLALLAGIDQFVGTEFGVLVGVSRKGMMGRIHAASDHGIELGEATATPTDDRLEASLAVATWCAALGVDMVRVHDVAQTVQALKVVVAGNSA